MDNVQKFQDLLKELFQFETSDLDFGIYRILNYKRDQIKKFIQEDLVNKVYSAFAKHKDERLTNINQRFDEVKDKIIQSLGKEAFTPTSELKQQFKDTPLGRDYLTIKAQKEEAQTIDDIKLQVFNDLYSFFSRFYEEGDFVPQYRYSIKGHKYAIPYNGEEVRLYWANSDQYYTKTGLLFRDYTCKLNDYKVIFRIVSAIEELGSKKATKERFFVLDDENPIEILPSPLAGEGKGEGDIKDKTLIIRFQYRELTDKEVNHYEVDGGSNTSKQEKINQKTYDEVLKKVKDIELRASLGKEYKPVLRNSEGTEKPLLLYQISRFTAKNTKDYFIHKNLKKFLSEQLDFFIKAEVLSIETLEREKFLDKHITRAKVVREIGEDIIDFLSQIEDFQKRLWEKKKFVLKTDYVITSDSVPEEFYDEIWNNKEQKKEWKELEFEIATPTARNDKKGKSLRGANATKQSLKKLHLPIDTRYFSQEFKERLLEILTEGHAERSEASLDDLLDGLLIKSENYQALTLLSEKYKGNTKCIYIDPPFNSKATEILYRNFYKHSSWLSLMENTILHAAKLLEDKGVFICAIDENEQERLGMLLNFLFPAYEKTCVTVVHNPGGIQGQNFSYTHEYAYFVFPSDGEYIGRVERDKADKVPLRDWGGEESKRESASNCFYPIYIKDNEIIGFGNVCPDEFHPSSANIQNKDRTIIVYPIDNNKVERKWRHSRQTVETIKDELKCEKIGSEYVIIRYKSVYRYKTVWTDKKYNSNVYGSKLLNDMFGFNAYTFPKSLYNVLDCVHATTHNSKNAIILDFFAGSGTTAHAVMDLNKEDGGKRKYILVEMANYIDTVIIPRIKKVCYSLKWKGGKPQDADGTSQFFKYQILEQYEDTLDNIELTPNETAQTLFKDDYLLKYYLDYETRGNPSLLNIEMLKNPFTYKLKVNLEEVGVPQEMVVDIPETFNYLLGIKIKKIKVREIASPSAHNDRKKKPLRGKETTEAISNRKYLFVLGEKEGKDIAIVWREYEDKPPLSGDEGWSEDDFKKDKEFIIKELASWTPHIVYVNGQSVLTPKLGETPVEIRPIEPEFKRLMEG